MMETPIIREIINVCQRDTNLMNYAVKSTRIMKSKKRYKAACNPKRYHKI